MRWWLLLLGGVVAFSLILWVVHPAKPTIGSQVLLRLIHEDERTKVRGAIELIDYVPEADLSAPPDWKRGNGGLPQINALNQIDPQHSFWMTGPNFRSWWNTPPAVINPLRAALAEGSDVRNRVRVAMAGDDAAAADKALAQAAHDLAAMNDESLFNAWVRSDRELLATQDDLVSAAREGLLLAARPNDGPVLTFKLPGAHVYLVPLFSASAAIWLEMNVFDTGGALVASGTLQVDEAKPSDPADPAVVQKLAGQVATAALSSGAATSTRPSDLQPLHQLPR